MNKKKFMFLITIIIYILGLMFGVILSEVKLINFVKDINIEKILFLLYNIYIIVLLILLGSNKLNSKPNKYYIVTLLVYIIFQVVYFVWQVYKILIMYQLNSDANMLIGTNIIKPNGLLFNILIPIILLQLGMLFMNKNENQ